jgi:hypothetical protein
MSSKLVVLTREDGNSEASFGTIKTRWLPFSEQRVELPVENLIEQI